MTGVGGGSFVPAQSITVALRDLYSAMDRGASFSPVVLLQVLQLAFPRFAEKGAGGVYMQQDANECWTELVRMLQQKLPAKASDGAVNAPKYVHLKCFPFFLSSHQLCTNFLSTLY